MKKLLLQVVVIFILTFLITGFIEDFAKRLWIYKIAFPEQSALESFQPEDFIFSTRKTNGLKDKDIVLVNIGHAPRSTIAEQISILSEYDPKVIGVAVFFNCGGEKDTINCPQLLDTAGNGSLHRAIKKSKKVVLATRLLQTNSKQKYLDSLEKAGSPFEFEYDSLEFSDSEFSRYAGNGFANLITYGQYDGRLCRSFVPMMPIKGVPHNAFAIEVSRRYDSSLTKKLDLENELWVNYRGNISIKNNGDTSYNYRRTEHYVSLDIDDILKRKFKPEEIKDKIVLMGYLGDYLSDISFEDFYYSPLNANPLGKSLPDMYGLVIHANIISMILHDDLITKMSPALSFWLSIFIVLMNIMVFISLEKMETVWKEAFIIIVPASQIIFISVMRYFVFDKFNYIIDLSSATVMLVSVSLATTLYFGPILHLVGKVRGVLRK